jgi:hypothetical protein
MPCERGADEEMEHTKYILPQDSNSRELIVSKEILGAQDKLFGPGCTS